MDGILLQSKIYGGYAKAARRVGLDFDIYRPTSAINPLADGNKISTIKASFTIHRAAQFNYDKPADFKGPLFHALLDGTQVKVGDYLKGVSTVFGPFYIASLDPIVPILAVKSERIITIWRPDGAAVKPLGASGYAGTVAATATANETALMTNWPASVVEGSGAVNLGALPADGGVSTWRITLPRWADVLIEEGHIITDDIGNRMVVRQVELSNLGWNCQAVQALV